MKIFPTFLLTLLILALIPQATSIDCINSHLDFTGKYTLGKQDQLNRTFTKMQDKISVLSDVTFNTSSTSYFNITKAKPQFFYRDSKQQSKINGKDTIVIYGGQLDVRVDFEWSKFDLVRRSGTGSAFAASSAIVFAKNLIIDDVDFSYSFSLLDAADIEFNTQSGNGFRVDRIDPANSTVEDIQVLTRMFNDIMGVKTIKVLLEEEIEKYYRYYLNNSLHDEHQPISTHFDYQWIPFNSTTPKATITFKRRPILVDLEELGLTATFDVQIENYTDWKCPVRDVPILPLSASIYGPQQFISLDFYENVIRYAISKNLLDAELNRQNWSSRMFQFYAGDLYEILPKVATMYYASEPVNGNCRATYGNLKVWKNDFFTFNVSYSYECDVNIKYKVLGFTAQLTLMVEGVPNFNSTDFRIRGHEELVTFNQYMDYKIENVELAKLMVKHSLNRMYEGRLFGSGWPASPPRDYPHFVVESNYTIVYDSSHIPDTQ